MTTAMQKPLPRATLPWSNLQTGSPAEPFAQYMQALDAIVKLLNTGMLGPLTDAVDDVAAAAAGVPINGVYRNGNALQIRLT